ncbi:aldo/keto reductase [Streptomyces phytophilus]|uniref:aldo/keto reductase n=1 Tax=Streptomyces phytophilus TaxID=722715 RepID=UPI0015F0EE5E|nr:aldo/keto reductase [Streptomyces phytophilus]
MHNSPDRTSRATGAVGWGILGTGGIAARFAGQLPRSRTGALAAVGSRSPASARAFAQRFAAPRAHGSYQELLDDDSVDAVYVATPHPQHVEWAVRAAEAGKHVLVEKPMAVGSAWATAVVEAAVRGDVFLMEAYMYRCTPQTAKLVELVGDGAVGELHHIQAQFSFGGPGFDAGHRLFDNALAGGGILDVGGYPVSMARLLAGAAAGLPFADPERVTAAGTVGRTGVDEWALATLHFAGGLTAQVATGIRLAGDNRVRVYGSRGFLDVPDPWFCGDGEPTRLVLHRVGEEREEIEVPPAHIYAAEADAVADHLADRQAPQMSWDDTLGNLAVQDAWRAAIGQRYDSERADAPVPTASGRPLARRADAPMLHARIPGVDKDISRLVMGVDNQVDQIHASVVFDDFFERGGTAFDTAYLYGEGRLEQQLGRWMAVRGVREDVVVIGKGAHTPHCDPASLSRQLATSLERLGTDRVDIYLLHRDNPDIPVGEFVDVLDEHRRAGRIGVYGGSNWSPRRFDEANEWARRNGRQPFTVLSNHLSLARAKALPWEGCRHVSDPQAQDWLRDRGVALFPWSSQARGFFTGRARPDGTGDAELVRCFYSDENFERLDRARKLARDRGVHPTAIALAWLLHQQYPVFPLIGPRQISETRTSLAGLGVRLSAQEVSWLDLREE